MKKIESGCEEKKWRKLPAVNFYGSPTTDFGKFFGLNKEGKTTVHSVKNANEVDESGDIQE